MLFSEEMSVLSDRFREITITLSGPSSVPKNIPPTWLQVEAGEAVIRFVDSNFHQATTRELAEIFPSAGDISIEPIPLRSIFLAIAKNGRTALRKTEEGKAEA
jgi:ABC-2 type transport system ATP-binding protein